jgi:sugar phosphate isomerase/epimerase
MELGVMVDIDSETNLADAFAEAREAGFSRGQVNVYVNGFTAEDVRLIAVAANDAQFHVDAVGCYMNPLHPDDPSLNSTDLGDWKTLVANMSMMNGVERIVCWSGTLGKAVGSPNLLNQETATFNSAYNAITEMLEQVRGFPIEILLDPYITHVLHDVSSCLRMAQKFPGGEVKIVLDAPNLIVKQDFAHRDERAQEIVHHLGPAVGLVHLRDMAPKDDLRRKFAAPGSGTLDYPAYVGAINKYTPDVPIIVAQVKGVAQMEAAREFVEGALKEYRRTQTPTWGRRAVPPLTQPDA